MHGVIPITTCGTGDGSSDNRAVKPPDQGTSRPGRMHGSDRPLGEVRTVDGRNRTAERPNFVVELRGERGVKSEAEVRAVAERFGSKADGFRWFGGGRGVAMELFFTEWSQALEGTVSMWELRFDGLHNWAPAVVSKVMLPSDAAELDEKLKAVFCERVEGLVEGEVAERWEKRMSAVLDDIARVSKQLKRFNSLAVNKKLTDDMAGLKEERELVSKRLREFRAAMECVVGYLRGKTDVGKVFKFDGDLDWERIYLLIRREVKRLEDGLPIYSFRQEILRVLGDNQMMVLIGETGSGKSTQLVQFLVDSGLIANGSIVCTQPRKIAATSLAQRVSQEVSGCYKDVPITSCQTYEPSQEVNTGVVFMTDHCLLQHYLRDRNLSGVTYIVVDEAHERSLNTDILLALLKDLLCRRKDMKLIIMSATADAKQLSDYLFSCAVFTVPGRHFPVDVRYLIRPSESMLDPGGVSSYVSEVVRMAADLHRSEKGGTILAFLTSPMEVEWACEKFLASSAVALPLHGKLSSEEQFRVYQNYPGQRKVIFATNIAETSLTIPGVKYVIDCGMVKESKFNPGTGMNVIKVCRISQSAANQRCGRAGRTEPGRCYRLYTKSDFDQMSPHQEPEIRRVHLGIAVLRIIALGVKDIKKFDFVDAPSSESIEMAIRNLIQLGAVVEKNDILYLTEDGWRFVKLGIEPRLGKLLVGCFHYGLLREGVVLAAVMANANSIFCRVGNDENKLKADSLKVQFCHQNGDIFTVLSVYKEWESMPRESRKNWCWDNSINGKSMRRCEDTVLELENCIKKELGIVVPPDWDWNPYVATVHDKHLKSVLLSSLAENVAMYSGCNLLGYEVALTGQYVQLHPSCSLLVFGHNPRWVVFGDLISTSSQYLTCVSAFDFDALSTLDPPPPFSVSKLLTRKLDIHVFNGFGATALKRFCGKFNCNMRSLLSHLRADFNDDRIRIQVNADENQILVFASSKDLKRVSDIVKDAVEQERKALLNECLERRLYDDQGSCPSVALFGAGAEIKHLELDKRPLSVDISFLNSNNIPDKELLAFLERFTSGAICAVHKNAGQENEKSRLWGRVTFLTPDAAEKAVELNRVEYAGALLKVDPSHKVFGGDNKMFQFPSVRARILWPRRQSKGVAIVKYDVPDAMSIIERFYNLVIGGIQVRCELGRKDASSIAIFGLDTEISEAEVLDELRAISHIRILDFFLVRGNAADSPSLGFLEEAILREISPFMPKQIPRIHCCRVKVFPPEARDVFMSAVITFDGRLHLEAAKALESIEGSVLPGCLPWQKIRCQPVFNSFVSCPATVYRVIKHQLDLLLAEFNKWKGVECGLSWNNNGSCRVKISANATKIVAEVRRPLEQLMQGKTLKHPSLSPAILQQLFSREGISLMKNIQDETGTIIFFDKYSCTVKVFGTEDKVAKVEERITRSLVEMHENRKLEICLRGGGRPHDLMKEVVKCFGPDLQGLKEKVPEADLSLNIKRHIVYVGGSVEMKQRVEEAIFSIVEAGVLSSDVVGCYNEVTCPICLCEVEDAYRLDDCGHRFCQACLVEQCESAIRSQDSFPLRCTEKGCQALIVMSDLRSLLSTEKLDELFRSSLGSFVGSSRGAYRFCPSPDCPSVYRAGDPSDPAPPGFACGACLVETCTRCHLEFHPNISCEQYQEFKTDPDASLKEWCRGKDDHVKSCPICRRVIEKIEGCNHMECLCGVHICWACLAAFACGEDCYDHMRSVHQTII